MVNEPFLHRGHRHQSGYLSVLLRRRVTALLHSRHCLPRLTRQNTIQLCILFICSSYFLSLAHIDPAHLYCNSSVPVWTGLLVDYFHGTWSTQTCAAALPLQIWIPIQWPIRESTAMGNFGRLAVFRVDFTWNESSSNKWGWIWTHAYIYVEHV